MKQLTCPEPDIEMIEDKSAPATLNRSISMSNALTHIMVGAVTISPSSWTLTPPWVLKNNNNSEIVNIILGQETIFMQNWSTNDTSFWVKNEIWYIIYIIYKYILQILSKIIIKN